MTTAGMVQPAPFRLEFATYPGGSSDEGCGRAGTRFMQAASAKSLHTSSVTSGIPTPKPAGIKAWPLRLLGTPAPRRTLRTIAKNCETALVSCLLWTAVGGLLSENVAVGGPMS
jgi:hypothetical protein